MSAKLPEMQQSWKEGGEVIHSGTRWHQVRKLDTNALKSLTCELAMSVEGIRLTEEFASRVRGKIEVQEFVP